jgi:hypothetical protein
MSVDEQGEIRITLPEKCCDIIVEVVNAVIHHSETSAKPIASQID